MRTLEGKTQVIVHIRWSPKVTAPWEQMVISCQSSNLEFRNKACGKGISSLEARSWTTESSKSAPATRQSLQPSNNIPHCPSWSDLHRLSLLGSHQLLQSNFQGMGINSITILSQDVKKQYWHFDYNHILWTYPKTRLKYSPAVTCHFGVFCLSHVLVANDRPPSKND